MRSLILSKLEEQIANPRLHTKEKVITFIEDLWRFTSASTVPEDPQNDLSEITFASFIMEINEVRPSPESFLRSLLQKLKHLSWEDQLPGLSNLKPVPQFPGKTSKNISRADDNPSCSAVRSVVRKPLNEFDDEEDDNVDNGDITWKRRDEKQRRCEKEDQNEETPSEPIEENSSMVNTSNPDILVTNVDR